MPDRPNAGAAAGDDRHRSVRAKAAAERVGVVAAVRGEPPKLTRCGCDDIRRHLNVADIARRQVDHTGATEDIGDDVDLRGLAAARGAYGLRLRPPLPP